MTRWALPPALIAGLATAAAACPFCTAVKPSLSQRIADADQAALVEVASAAVDQVRCTVRRPLAGAEHFAKSAAIAFAPGELSGAKPLGAGELGLLLATRADARQALSWEIVPLDEVGYAYIARGPARRLPAEQRLGYYAKFLEHANPILAEDAYLEFGNASYDDVAQVADQLPMPAMRRWITDPRVPESRKGFYGLALGLATTDQDRQANMAVLRRLIDTPADDFRAGFDGVLGGYLVLAGSDGLRHIDQRLLANPQAPSGDLRHAATALRFIHEFGRGAIPTVDLSRAMRRLLARPELAAPAIIDLARWQDWDSLEEIASLFSRKEYSDPATSRAIVGYLDTCPLPAAAEALSRLRRAEPRRVAEAEQAGVLPAGSR